jgi:hypothetical protein
MRVSAPDEIPSKENPSKEIPSRTEVASVPGHWIMAPVEAGPSGRFDKVWQFNLGPTFFTPLQTYTRQQNDCF